MKKGSFSITCRSSTSAITKNTVEPRYKDSLGTIFCISIGFPKYIWCREIGTFKLLVRYIEVLTGIRFIVVLLYSRLMFAIDTIGQARYGQARIGTNYVIYLELASEVACWFQFKKHLNFLTGVSNSLESHSCVHTCTWEVQSKNFEIYDIFRSTQLLFTWSLCDQSHVPLCRFISRSGKETMLAHYRKSDIA